MTEPLRTDLPNAGPLTDADRRARIEQLLLSGLDHYFAGKYEQAINIWTRVAFLERGHGRARAYIERARSALAERQRESEELLHTGVEAYQAGDLESARELLSRAVDEGGPNETALVLLQRLGSVEAAAARARQDGPGRSFPYMPQVAHRERGSRWLATTAASVIVGLAILISAMPLTSWVSEWPVATTPALTARPEPLPIVRSVDLRLARARALHASGQVREALDVLDDIDIADARRPEADRLRAEFQRELLAAASAADAADEDASR